MTPRDTVFEGFRAIITEFPAMLERYKTQIDALDQSHAEKVAAHVTIDAAKAVVDVEVKAYHEKLIASVEADIKERADRRTNIEVSIAQLQKDRQDLLNDMAGKRAELAAMDGERLSKVRDRDAALEAVNAQVDSAKARLEKIEDDIERVLRSHGKVAS